MKLSQSSIQKKIDWYASLASKYALLAPPHYFDVSPTRCSLKEIKNMWENQNIATVKPKRNSLYIHVPYCLKRCSFCMYDSKILRKGNISPYIDLIIREYDFWTDSIQSPLDSFYIGGGTPSIMEPSDIRRLFEALKHLKFREDSSRTFELSPDTVTPEKIYELGNTFINRVSLGVQSLDDSVLQKANRSNKSAYSLKHIVSTLKEISLDDINIDIMVGLNGQTVSNVKSSIEQVIEMNPLSITIYSYRDVHNISELKLDERIVKIHDQLTCAYNILKSAGWRHASGNINTEYNIFHSSDMNKELIRHKTSIDVFNNLNLFGLGNHAIGFNPSLAYECDTYTNNFNIDKSQYTVFKHSVIQQMRLAVCNMLYSNNMQIDSNLFYEYFGCHFSDVFAKELEELSSINSLVKKSNIFKFINNSQYEAAAIQMYFWDEKFLQQFK